VPRQIANAATLWATANTLIFLPFAALFAAMAIKLIPDRAVEEKAIIRPKYLDDELIQVPSMALERARMELGHMGELTEAMLAKVKAAFTSRDLSELSQQHDQVVVLREAVMAYLQRVGRGELSDAEADEHADLVAAAGEIVNMSAAISRDLAPLARVPEGGDITPSPRPRNCWRNCSRRCRHPPMARCWPWWMEMSGKRRPCWRIAVLCWKLPPN
jgi:phosphate:Na+ symporter